MSYDSHFVIEVLHQLDLLSDTFSDNTVPKVTFDWCIIYMSLTRCLILIQMVRALMSQQKSKNYC